MYKCIILKSRARFQIETLGWGKKIQMENSNCGTGNRLLPPPEKNKERERKRERKWR